MSKPPWLQRALALRVRVSQSAKTSLEALMGKTGYTQNQVVDLALRRVTSRQLHRQASEDARDVLKWKERREVDGVEVVDES